ncbi:putative aquaporin 4 [Mycena maculata]|uniref:Aquaporin 4 n=1 Tax=Mycena maculata TaxID=230809 RepID=A0AAD7K6P9_9AGAR|nr:putative aquaporin 4 [Mycena maculata]
MSLSKDPEGMINSEDSGSKEAHSPEHSETFTAYRNAWSYYRLTIREYVAGFLGVCILIIFGVGVQCQVARSGVTAVAASAKGDYLSISFGWGIGIAMGVWVSGGISGGHINPAVTIILASYRGFPSKKVPGYILSQVMGGLVGAVLIYANYIHAIDIFEGGRHVRTLATASLFSTYAAEYMTPASAEFLATAVLAASLGMETGYAINPARDLGPRILTAMVGYGKQVFTFRNQYWLWCPILAPILGAQAGAIFYDAFIYTGDESPFNKPRNVVAYQNHATRRHISGADSKV